MAQQAGWLQKLSQRASLILGRAAAVHKALQRLIPSPDALQVEAFTHLPANLASLVAVLRLHRPAALTMMIWPALWGYFMTPHPAFKTTCGLVVLVVLMRLATNLYDDISNINIATPDEKTRRYPTRQGTNMLLLVSLMLLILICAGLLGGLVLFFAISWLILASLHPMMYKITWLPQLFDGVVFGAWAVLLGQAAAGALGLEVFFLVPAALLWVTGIETLRAELKRARDVRSGTKSIALVLGEAWHKPFIQSCFIGTLVLMVLTCIVADTGRIVFLAPVAAQFILMPVLQGKSSKERLNAWRLYRRTMLAGAVLTLGLVLAL